jgi:predicted PurR-regulated permease PerM
MLDRKIADNTPLISAQHFETLLVLLILLIGLYLCYRMTQPFISILTGALTLAVLFSPFQHWLKRKLVNTNVATFVCLSVIAILVVIPILFILQQFIMQLFNSAVLLEKALNNGVWKSQLNAHPNIAYYYHQIEPYIDIPNLVQSSNAWLISVSADFVRDSTVNVISISLIFYLLYFMLRDSATMQHTIVGLSPLSKPEMYRLFQYIGTTIRTVVFGILTIALIQGALGGLMFWWLGLPAPLVWAVVMGLLSLIPILGTFIVWIPASIYLMLSGEWQKAITLIIWGMFVIGTIDNLLRPYLVGNRLHLHTMLVFISILGGLIVYGAAGLILGPLTLTVTYFLISIWKLRPT